MAARGGPGGPGQAADLAVAGGMGPDRVVDLAVPGGMGPGRVGSKAFNLARLAAADLPVPAGFVVTPEAFQAWEVAKPAVAAAARRLGGDRYAVRSSAAAEDLPGASYAGMYESVLNVAPAGVTAAVWQVRESAAAGRVTAYRDGRARGAGRAPAGAMAVLVQVMVEA